MKPDFTKLIQLIEARPGRKPSDHRNDERRAADAAIGDEVEWIVANYCWQHGLSVQKTVPFGFDRLAHPAGYFGQKDPEDGDLVPGHFVALDLQVSGTTSFMAEVKLKPFQRNGNGRFYPLDRIRLQRMGKAYRHASDLQHLFVVLDPKRREAPAYGLFAAPVDQLMANASTYQIQIGHAEPFYRIPLTEFRPLTHFLKQHNTTKDYAHVVPPEPLPRIDEAA